MKSGTAVAADRLVAIVVTLAGLFIMWEGSRYSFGTLARIGPGFFPVMIGAAIAAVGILLAIRTRGEGVDLPGFRIRPLVVVPAAILVFILGLERFGIVPTTIAMTVLATAAERPFDPRFTAAVVAIVLILAILLFHLAFRIPVPLVDWPG